MTLQKKTAASTATPKRAAGTRPAPRKKTAAAGAAAATAKKPPPRKAASPAARERLTPEPEVVSQIRELEAQLDRLIDQASRRDLSALDTDGDEDDGPPSGEDAAERISRTELPTAYDVPDASRDDAQPSGETPDTPQEFANPRRLGIAQSRIPEPRPSSPSSPSIPPAPESVFDTARELLSTDFYLRKWGRLGMRGRSEEVDDFGYDPVYEAKLKPLLDFLYATYFRVETTGIEHVPAQGRCLLVANHSGTLPLDGVMLRAAVKREHAAARDVRWLTEDFITHFPYLGSAMNRLGAVRANQENAERLLDKEQLVAVFPEGVKGIGKLFKERYRLQRFGRGGFIKLCLRTSTPIVPIAVMGAEETSPLLFKIEHLSKALGVPYIPVTPTFPLLGPLGLLPAPTKWRIQFGEPLDLTPHGPEAADDEILVGKLGERVRAAIQGMLDRAVGARKSVFFG